MPENEQHQPDKDPSIIKESGEGQAPRNPVPPSERDSPDPGRDSSDTP